MAPPVIASLRPLVTVRNLERGLGLFFLGAGAIKLAGLPVMVQLFEDMGMGQWLRYVVGASEMAGGALLLAPAGAALGALMLSGVMLGAFAGNVVILRTPPLAPAAVLVLLMIILRARRTELWTLARGAVRIRHGGGA
jgi:hypothetical protein